MSPGFVDAERIEVWRVVEDTEEIMMVAGKSRPLHIAFVPGFHFVFTNGAMR